jgi:hypothetical protein
MKAIILIGLSFLLIAPAMAQSNKQVNWVWSAKKIGDRTYEVHMTATIGGDFHLYAQDAGGDGPIATAFTFNKSPLLTLDGVVKENGKLVRKYEEAWKSDVKTSLAGKVEFMVCNDHECLPPADVDIRIPIGG